MQDRRWHLCAPPGAGKTLIGLELARQVGAPTLVLAPTTAVREQWQAATALFGADPATFTSDDPAVPAPLLVMTYHLLGNPGEAAGELRAVARRLWIADVASTAGLEPEVAEGRVAVTEERDPDRARRELKRHVRALRRSLATGEDIGVPRHELLGDRPMALIDQLAAAGIGCVVLDECHHLLDWWALVISALVERVGQDRDVAVVGLTATLPEPESRREAENYLGLLGEVDAELQLAAMVAEGALAPWRDGVHVAQLSEPERAFLDHWTEAFAAELDSRLASEEFIDWAVSSVTSAALDARDPEPGQERVSDPAAWDRFWDRDPLTAAAQARWWTQRGMELPAGFSPPIPAVVVRKLDLVDRLTLIHAWLHDPAADLGDEIRRDIGGLTRRYGVTLTTAGLRWGRSVADLVCARSSAKGVAAAEVLAGEIRRRGSDLRALVVVERDTATSPPAAARAVLGDDAGTAARTLAALCGRPEVVDRGVMLVTGRGAWADALAAERICSAVNVMEGASGRWLQTEGCDIRGAVRLVGHGGPRNSARWLGVAEAALDDGDVQVLVATRGLVGEGWDHPRLNVLVDLSEVASSTAMTQLRGRAIRLDPHDPAKLASLWDVVVSHPVAPGDWQRLRRRHRRWWGPDADGDLTTGPVKLHARAGKHEPPSPEEAARLNAESVALVADEAASLRAWDRVDPGGVGTSAVHVRPLRRRRVRTRATGWRWLTAAATACALSGLVVAVAAVSTPVLWPLAVAVVAPALPLGRAARGREQDERETLAALAEAVLAGLVEAGNDDLTDAAVAVEPDPAGGWIALVDGVPDDAAGRWADALAEVLGSLGTPRWMVAVRGSTRAWRVPAAAGTTKEAAVAFVRAFGSRVPKAELVRAGTPRATELVLSAASQRPDEIGRSLRWR